MTDSGEFSDCYNYLMKKTKMSFDEFDSGVFLVNALAVIFDPATKKFLIARRENDPYIKNLSWVFIGGRPDYNNDLESSFEKIVEQKSGLKVKSLGPVFSRIFSEDHRMLFIYYLCEMLGGKLKTTGKYKEYKWVNADELEKYFTTSFDPRLKEFIMNLR